MLAFRLPTVPAARLPACPVGSVASVQKSRVAGVVAYVKNGWFAAVAEFGVRPYRARW
jgi:hypothetical protein